MRGNTRLKRSYVLIWHQGPFLLLARTARKISTHPNGRLGVFLAASLHLALAREVALTQCLGCPIYSLYFNHRDGLSLWVPKLAYSPADQSGLSDRTNSTDSLFSPLPTDPKTLIDRLMIMPVSVPKEVGEIEDHLESAFEG